MAYDINSLNELQKQIALDTTGAILVSAGAGSGKTRLLTHRICHLVNDLNISPSNILAITFTNKATLEMKERLSTMLNNSMGLWISTFHSMCAKILRNNIDKIEGFDCHFTVYDEADKDKILKDILKDIPLDEPIEFRKSLAHYISMAKNLGLNPDEYLAENKYTRGIEETCQYYSKYQEILKKNNALDFDDLMLKTLELFYVSKQTLEYYQHKFMYIHVDEFQDTNLVQYKLLCMLGGLYKNIFVVGDEDQSIYGWRGANIENINSFKKDFDCKVYKLEQNYRSTKKILNVANKLIKNNISRIDKTLFTENDDGEDVCYYEADTEKEESEYVARSIKNLLSNGINKSEIGVLMRVSALSRLIEEKCLNYNIPYKVSGITKFFDRLEIKNILAYLRCINNTKDENNLLRIINFPKRNIGLSTVEKLIQIATINDDSLFDTITNYQSLDISNTIKNKIENFADLIIDLQEKSKELGLVDFVKYVLDNSGISGLYNTREEDDINRKMNIDQFSQSVNDFAKLNEDANLTDYLESVTLQNDIAETEEEKISISTVHASKGLEFDYVYIIGVEEGRFPLFRNGDNEGSIEEERRLMYVATTRAKKKLFLTRAKSRYMYNERNYTAKSRFIKEMELAPKSSNINSNYSEFAGSQVNQNVSTSMFKQLNTVNKVTEFFGKTSKNFDEFKVGVKVSHPKFGAGMIIKREGLGVNAFVSIDFGKLGVKLLSLNFAPLTIIK